MVTNNIYPAFIICIFVVFLIIVVTFYIDYRKHSDQVEQIYNLLIKSKLLKIEDYQAGKILGFGDLVFVP